ncbi:MAG: ECF transporter S component [Clostridia bacterium]|nr:ECF transporter S component [Clostridia bacterium]
MKNKKILKLVITALFMALTTVATLVVQIPSPTKGYVNLGDAVVLLSAWLLGPAYGTLAAGIGSMLTDIITGYVAYAPGTLVIKAGIALVAYFSFKAFGKQTAESRGKRTAARIVSGIAGEIVMILGYFGYASLLLGKGFAAVASIPGNCVQAVIGIVVSVLLIELLTANSKIRAFVKDIS